MVLHGYIRVSRAAGQEHFISADLQRDQIGGWAQAHDATLVTLHEDLDKSGAGLFLVEALKRVEAGESDGLIVARLDRLCSSAREGLQIIRRIEEAGGTLVSVQEGFDLGTSRGRQMRRALVSISEWELPPDSVASTVAFPRNLRRRP